MEIAIGEIFHKFFDFLLRHREEGTDHVAISWTHAGKPLRPAATKEMKENRLRLVVRVMSRGDGVIALFRRYLPKSFIAQLPSHRFEGPLALLHGPSHIHVPAIKRNGKLVTNLPHILSLLLRLGAEMVLHRAAADTKGLASFYFLQKK